MAETAVSLPNAPKVVLACQRYRLLGSSSEALVIFGILRMRCSCKFRDELMNCGDILRSSWCLDSTDMTLLIIVVLRVVHWNLITTRPTPP